MGLSAILVSFSLLVSLFTSGVFWFEYAPRMAVLLLAVLGLYGYAWKKRLATKIVWKMVFLFFLAVTAFVLWRSYPSTMATPSIVLGGILLFPLFYGIYQYAFRSQDIWGEEN